MKENNTSNNFLLNDSNTSPKKYIFNENENENNLNNKYLKIEQKENDSLKNEEKYKIYENSHKKKIFEKNYGQKISLFNSGFFSSIYLTPSLPLGSIKFTGFPPQYAYGDML